MKLLATILLFVTIPAAAQTLTVEERLAKLEQEVVSLREENTKLRQELGLAVSVPPKEVVKSGPAATVQLGGFVQGQLESGDRSDSRFPEEDRAFVRRARLNATGKFVENFDYRLELDLAGSLSSSSSMRAQLTDAYTTWTRYPGANVRIGQFKTPFGYEQLQSDTKLLLAERSLANDRLTAGRQLGVQLAGSFADKRVSYAVGAFNGDGANDNANDDEHFLTAGRLASQLFRRKSGERQTTVTAGVNALFSRDTAVTFSSDFGFDSTPSSSARDNIFQGDRRGLGGDVQLVTGPLEVWAEYLALRFEPENLLPRRELESDGIYAHAAWSFVPNKLQGVVRYESFDAGEGSVTGDTDFWILGANYYIHGHDLKLQLDYILNDSDDEAGRFIARIQSVF